MEFIWVYGRTGGRAGAWKADVDEVDDLGCDALSSAAAYAPCHCDTRPPVRPSVGRSPWPVDSPRLRRRVGILRSWEVVVTGRTDGRLIDRREERPTWPAWLIRWQPAGPAPRTSRSLWDKPDRQTDRQTEEVTQATPPICGEATGRYASQMRVDGLTAVDDDATRSWMNVVHQIANSNHLGRHVTRLHIVYNRTSTCFLLSHAITADTIAFNIDRFPELTLRNILQCRCSISNVIQLEPVWLFYQRLRWRRYRFIFITPINVIISKLRCCRHRKIVCNPINCNESIYSMYKIWFSLYSHHLAMNMKL